MRSADAERIHSARRFKAAQPWRTKGLSCALWKNSAPPLPVLESRTARPKPGTLFGCPAGAIGWAMGAPLGAKVAAPEKTVVSLLTDGGFIWGCPTSTLWTAVKYGAPFLAVVFNNQGYGILRGSLRHVLGTDSLPDPYIFEAGAEFMPDYAMIARACGAYGRTVDDPADVLPALNEALAAVRAGQAAVLDVRLGRN